MRRVLLLGVLAVLVSGCKISYLGNLKVTSTIEIKHEVRDTTGATQPPVRFETARIEPGNYKAQVSLFGCCEFGIAVDSKSSKGRTYRFPIPNKKRSLPDADGDFFLKAEDIGQNFDLVGNIKTETTKSDIMRMNQMCQYQDYVTVCDDRGCYTRPILRYGWQWTEFYYKTTKTYMTVIFKPKGQNSILGSFEGSRSESEKVIVSQGPCY
jgi:hypothetical protein